MSGFKHVCPHGEFEKVSNDLVEQILFYGANEELLKKKIGKYLKSVYYDGYYEGFVDGENSGD